jgi:putative hydrolase of the HAD superfamily
VARQAAAECITTHTRKRRSFGNCRLVRMTQESRSPPIETLSLDAGGVLVFPNWERVSRTLARHGVHVPAESLRRAEPAAKFSIDESRQISTSSDAQRGGLYMDRVLDGAGVPPGRGRDAALVELYDYHAEYNLWEYVPPDIVPALERLRARGLKLAVASNANGVIHRSFERTGLTRYFDAICDSCLEGVEKPDPRFFRLVVDRAGGRRETTLHVGDLYHVDVVGARSAGLQAMLLDPHGLYAGFDVDCVRSLGELVERMS